jgi:hypothetical protein
MTHVQELEDLNETFYFKFDKKTQELAESALYITVKKAFTPFASMHTLKQLALAQMAQWKIDEVSPL